MKKILFFGIFISLLTACSQIPRVENSKKEILDFLSTILEEIKEKEKSVDASCWSSTRHIEEFAASRQMSEEAQILKIKALKVLLYKIWIQSSRVDKKMVKESDIDFNIPIEKSLLIKNSERVSEGLRVVFDVGLEYLVRGQVHIKVLDQSGVKKMVDVANYLNEEMITYFRELPSKEISVAQIKGAYLFLEKKYGLSKVDANKSMGSPGFISEEIRSVGMKFSLTNAKNKILALRTWNNTLEGRVDRLNKVFEFKKKIGDKELLELKYFLYDLFLDINFNLNNHVGLAEVHNFINQYYYLLRSSNGDIRVDLKNPVNRSLKVHNYQMDALRDFAFHWELVADLYTENFLEKDKAMTKEWIDIDQSDFVVGIPYGLTAHGAELLSEVVAEIMTILLYSYQESEDTKFSNFLKKGLEFKKIGKNVPEVVADSSIFEKYLEPFLEYKDVPLQFNCSINEDELNLEHKNIGQGISLADFNKDGLPDLFVAGIYCNKYYKNMGDFKFKEEEILPKEVHSYRDVKQGIWFDYNHDGNLDLLLIRSENDSQVYIQKNNKLELAAKLPTVKGAHSGVLVDYDKDGDLDLFVLNYQGNEPRPSLDGSNGVANSFFIFDKGKFVEKDVGLSSVSGWSLVGNFIDYNKDGFFDLYVSNDFGYDEFYENDGNGRFLDKTKMVGLDDRGSCMNAEVVDFDNDGQEELYTSQVDTFSKKVNFLTPSDKDIIPLNDSILKTSFYISANKFYKVKNNTFVDYRYKWVEDINQGWSWSVRLVDIDNDGDLDLYGANGWIDGAVVDKEPDYLMINEDGRLYKAPLSLQGPLNIPSSSRSVAVADIDGDGDLDFVVTQYKSPMRFYKNNIKAKSFLSILLKGKSPNTLAVGSKVEVIRSSGEKILKIVRVNKGYLAQDPYSQWFGVGTDVKVDIRVTWPNGKSQMISGVKTNQHLEIVEE